MPAGDDRDPSWTGQTLALIYLGVLYILGFGYPARKTVCRAPVPTSAGVLRM
jgi:hypothetical protein